MSTFRNPVGPQPPQVYWRRRLLLGLGLVAVIVVVILIIVRPGSGGAPSPGEITKSPATAETDTPAEDGAACLSANLVLTAITDKSTYAAGEQPQIGMSLKNTGSTACTVNYGSTVQQLVITSGSEKYWDLKDCQSDAVDSEVTIKAGEVLATPTIAWNRTRSSTATCDADRPAVPAAGASYHLQVKLGDLASKETKQFQLF